MKEAATSSVKKKKSAWPKELYLKAAQKQASSDFLSNQGEFMRHQIRHEKNLIWTLN